MDFSALIAAYRPPSAVEQDVLDSLHRDERPLQPLRHLADCIIRGSPVAFIRQVIEEEDLLDRIDDPVHKGLRLLHYACFGHQGAVVEMLLDLGANPRLADNTGFTPVHVCAERGFDLCIDALVAYGADAWPQEGRAESPLRLALRNRHLDTAAALLCRHDARLLGDELFALPDAGDIAGVMLLLEHGAYVNVRDARGQTPLMRAARSEEDALEVVKLLISHGADVDAESPDDHKTALHYSVLMGRLEVTRALLESGARVRFVQPAVPPLHYAVLRGDPALMLLLLEAGADVNAATAAVGTALHLALTENVARQVEVVQTLLKNGADPNAILKEAATGRPLIKPPIGEYLHHCEHPKTNIIRMMLRHGARILFRTQRDHPLGIVKVIHRIHLGLNMDVMRLLTDASESTDITFVQQSKQLSADHKEILLRNVNMPLTLLHWARLTLRRSLKWGPVFLKTILGFPLPQHLLSYMLFDE